MSRTDGCRESEQWSNSNEKVLGCACRRTAMVEKRHPTSLAGCARYVDERKTRRAAGSEVTVTVCRCELRFRDGDDVRLDVGVQLIEGFTLVERAFTRQRLVWCLGRWRFRFLKRLVGRSIHRPYRRRRM